MTEKGEKAKGQDERSVGQSELMDGLAAVTIHKKKAYYCKDELYCDWYKCPECGDSYIRLADNYCSHCGVKFNWETGS